MTYSVKPTERGMNPWLKGCLITLLLLFLLAAGLVLLVLWQCANWHL